MNNGIKKKDIMKKLGISQESFDFYLSMGKIRHLGRGKYEYDKEMEHQILEKSTVFKYHFSDNFIEDGNDFANQVRYTGKVKKYSKDEIKKLEEQMRKEGKLGPSKKDSQKR